MRSDAKVCKDVGSRMSNHYFGLDLGALTKSKSSQAQPITSKQNLQTRSCIVQCVAWGGGSTCGLETPSAC